MKKELAVTSVCIIFIVGLGAQSFYSGFTFKKELSISDVVGMLSAVAAAIAAWAAWRAADIAKSSTDSNNSYSRAQLYIGHRADFLEMLDYTAKELKVIFYRKNDLYSKLFPNNHYSGDVFEAKGSDDVFDLWIQLRTNIVKDSGFKLSDDDLCEWIEDCMEVRSGMHFEDERQTEPQICLWAFTASPCPTGFVSSPARHVFNISEVMNRIMNFCGREGLGDILLGGQPFEVHYRDFYNRLNQGHSHHYVGMPGEPIIRK